MVMLVRNYAAYYVDIYVKLSFSAKHISSRISTVLQIKLKKCKMHAQSWQNVSYPKARMRQTKVLDEKFQLNCCFTYPVQSSNRKDAFNLAKRKN